MPGWNIADVFEVVAGEIPTIPMLVQGSRSLTWAQVDRRARAIGAHLRAQGLARQDSVALYLRNSPEYLEGFLAALTASLVPVNTNYRYGPDELVHLWEDADARAVVFSSSFTATIERIRERVPDVTAWLCVDDGGGTCPAWAAPYEDVAGSTPNVDHRAERDGDDLILLYTGGTTGMPKGVMWRQDDVHMLLGKATSAGYDDEQDLALIRAGVAERPRRHIPAAPLMHGAGIFTCLPILSRGGTIVLLEHPSFDAVELLDTIARERVHSVSWVGDAFAAPVIEALDAEPDRWDLTSLKTIMSGGVLFSEAGKQRLLEHLPRLVIVDMFGASEAIAGGRSIATVDQRPGPAGSFKPRVDVRVLTEDGRDVVPGSGEVGLLAYGGRQPLGYHKDEAKTATTFPVIDGTRYCVPGDWARVEPDGTITLIGRGSSVVNTGGEKVFPEEVEEVLKRHPDVHDAIVVGVPHERFGEMVVAIVEPVRGREVPHQGVIDHVRARLASYKAPRRLLEVAQIERGPSGKPDLVALRRLAIDRLAEGDPQ